jgi:hypothetical protein
MTQPRLWAWPAVTGSLTPPQPAVFLTWPAWEAYLRKNLNEAILPLMTPVYLSDPPNFTASLTNLSALAQEGGLMSPRLPFGDLGMGDLLAPLTGKKPLPKIPPYALVLALDHLARTQALAADLLVKKALAQNKELFESLTAQTQSDSAQIPAPIPSPVPGPTLAVAQAWWNLAKSVLAPGDLLWPVFGDLSPTDFWPKADLTADENGFYPCPELS